MAISSTGEFHSCPACKAPIIEAASTFMMPPEYKWVLPRENILSCECGAQIKVDYSIPDFVDEDDFPSYWWVVGLNSVDIPC